MTYHNRNKGALPPSFQGSERANVEPPPSSACEPPRFRHFYLFGFGFVVDLNRISRSAKQRVE